MTSSDDRTWRLSRGRSSRFALPAVAVACWLLCGRGAAASQLPLCADTPPSLGEHRDCDGDVGSIALLQVQASRDAKAARRSSAAGALPRGAAGGDAAGRATAAEVPTYLLNDGHEIPALGFGTPHSKNTPGNVTYEAVLEALRSGYRMVDTASFYENEQDVGRAILDSGIPRSEIFVATKLWNSDHGYQKALVAGKLSNEKLGLGYIDLLLIHSPLSRESGGKIVETYDALLELQNQGVVRSVGVSNFGVQHLKALESYCRPAPAVNQFEVHPMIVEKRRAVVKYCQEHDILVQAYGSMLAGFDRLLSLAEGIAQSHNKTESQVMLRWGIDHGYQVIPKSVHKQWIDENIDVFDFSLTEGELEALDSLEAPPGLAVQKDGSLRYYWDPLTAPVDIGHAESHCK